MIRYAATAAVVQAAIMVLPSLLHACPRCFESTGSSALGAYYLTAGVLSLLPLAIFGTVFFIVRKHARRQAQHEPHAGGADPERDSARGDSGPESS